MTDSLLVDRVGRVAVLTLNRPEARNAIDPELAAALERAWRELNADDEVWAVVLTGSGDKAFSAGADLKKTMPPAHSPIAGMLGAAPAPPDMLPPLEFDKPILCALNGVAVGGGFELALACDIQIAAPEVRMGLTETKVGSIPGAGGTQRLPRRVPMGVAQRMLMTGELMDAESALRYGLVTELVEAPRLRERAIEIATQICGNAPLAVRAARKAAYASELLPLDRGLELERMLFGLIRDTEDRIEGRKAFAEKRAPRFTAR